jgi:hypothetical protein
MATLKRTPVQPPVKYKREKGKMEISGDPNEIKRHIWFDQFNSFLLWAVPVTILLCFLPKVSWLPILIKWLKKALMILAPFLITMGYLMMQLSG